MKPKYILALDQGTTSSRAVLFNSRCEIVSMSQRPFNQQFPQPGWVEHNPLEIWSTQSFVMENVVNKADIEWSDIEALGITNQRETTVVWDRQTSEPVYNAIVWQDRRTADYCDVLRERGLTKRIREKTGLILDAYFSATKIRWILDNVPGARARAERDELCFGTVDSWLAWRLSGGRLHITDVSNASRTMLFDIHTLDWDDELLDLFDIPERQIEHRDIDNPGRKHAAHQCRVEQDARSILLAHHLLELHIGHVAVPAHLFGIERRTALHTHRRQLGTVPYDNQPTTASLTHVTNQVVEQISRPECRRIERVVGQHGCLIDDKHRIFFAVVIE